MIFSDNYFIKDMEPEAVNNLPQSQNDDVRTIFDSFDADKSGTIEVSELKNIAAKYNQNIPQEEMKKIIQSLDINGDGKISFQEFKLWWVGGRKGKLQELVLLQAKGLKLLNFAKKYFIDQGISLEGEKASAKETDRHEISVQFGDIILDAGVSIKVQNSYGGDKHKQHLQKLQKDVADYDPNAYNLILFIPVDDPSSAKVGFDSLIEQLKNFFKPQEQGAQEQASLDMFADIKCEAKQNHIVVSIKFINMGEMMLEMALGPMNQIEEILGQDFFANFNLSFQFNGTAEQFIVQNNAPMNALKGWRFQLFAQTNSVVMKKLRKLLEKKSDWQTIPLTLLRGTRINIKLKRPQDADNFLDGLGIKEQIKKISSAKEKITEMQEEGIKAKQEKGPKQLGYFISAFGKKNARGEMTAYLTSKKWVTKLEIKAPKASLLHDAFFGQN